jgi:hypothetical protein
MRFLGREFSRYTPEESWSKKEEEKTGVYSLSVDTRFDSSSRLINTLTAVHPSSDISLLPASRYSPAGIVMRVQAHSKSEAAAKAAARELYGGIVVKKSWRKGSLDIRHEPRGAGSSVDPAVQVDSAIAIYLSENQRRQIALASDSGAIILQQASGDAELKTTSGSLFVGGHRKGTLKAVTESGRVAVTNFGGDRIEVQSGGGDVIISGVDNAQLFVATKQDGRVNMKGVHVQTPSVVETENGLAEIGITNEDLFVAVSALDVISVRRPNEDLFTIDYDGPEFRGLDLMYTVRGFFGARERTTGEIFIKTVGGEVIFRKEGDGNGEEAV